MKLKLFTISFGVYLGDDLWYSLYFMPFNWSWGMSSPEITAIAGGPMLAIGPLYIAVQQ